MSLAEIARVTEVGFAGNIGLQFTEATGDRVRANWVVEPTIHQSHGIVHGGAYCTAVETLASIGASIFFGAHGRVVGVNNNTDFLQASTDGTHFGEATPLHRGRSQQLWQVLIRNNQHTLIARGQVRLQNLTR
ncbi:PaaI family thioesterase [Rhodococcus pseudokoreensis]|uniref:PaaI family thioesterase n=1 Tax=Rhodococcus pseudokoreensis TaxID=2811421 RepID=A0A974W8D4_9NOCA|nr:PaaI family thioesterase [Rhodococcus pseudokoreensis]QSE93016.1 PaaI family thioesterase [Rhodococcus pseudokoreensis]